MKFENGFDWVLLRLLAAPTSDADIRKMGVGGLQIASRPQAREPRD